MASPSRHLPLWIAFISAVACFGCSNTPKKTAAASPAAQAPRELPDVEVASLDGGERVGLREVVKGKVAVIDLWATWCTACREVTKNVELLHRAKQGTGLLVVGLDVGEERDKVESFLEGRKPAYPIYLDPALEVADGLGQTELPAIVVVDRSGAVRLVRNKVDADVLGLVDRLLAEEAPSSPAAAEAPPLMTAAPPASAAP